MIRSFEPSNDNIRTGPLGQRGHRDHFAQNDVITPQTTVIRDGVWNIVGNGLSNQSFIDAPEGIIAVDTGESNEEMRDAIKKLREHSDRPIVAVLYTHFHYVDGTRAVFEDAGKELPVYGHEKIASNRSRVASEIRAAYTRGLVEQFGIQMPNDGEDGLINIGLGFWYRNPAHAPFSSGFVPPTHTFSGHTSISVAGLDIDVRFAPSDADDSVTYWIPRLGVAIHNLVWPLLFNVFAIRGEEYRDPRVLLDGLDHLLSLNAEYLVATHGPPLVGRNNISEKITRYRDSIQFMWDQTVRGINKGWTSAELGERVVLPELYDVDYLTSERYGVAEHHVRQIHVGLRGWFDGDPSRLFPLPTRERATRLVKGLGGRDSVRAQVQEAIDHVDLRWSTELATWLVQSDGAEQLDRDLLARSLRAIAQRTPAANIRNWCITHARDLDGSTSLARHKVHSFRAHEVVSDPGGSLHVMRVMLDPSKANGLDVHLQFVVGMTTTGLHVRNCVAVPTDGTGATQQVSTSAEVLGQVLASKRGWDEAVTCGDITVHGDVDLVSRVLHSFECIK